MKKYFSFFRLRFSMGLQYRAAALAGVVTQFVWALMEILLFKAFYEAQPEAFPMTLEALGSYIWLQQAFLALFMAWLMEGEIFDGIVNGNIAYELCRPIGIYDMWFVRSVANRVSKAVLRCMPILMLALFLPKPFKLIFPPSFLNLVLFLITMVLGLLVTVAICMLVYIACFFTVSAAGVRMVAVCAIEFFSGAVIPLPFFTGKFKRIMELLPFAAMQNVPYRVYSGDLKGEGLVQAIALQVIWLLVLVGIGKKMSAKAMKKIKVQGG